MCGSCEVHRQIGGIRRRRAAITAKSMYVQGTTARVVQKGDISASQARSTAWYEALPTVGMLWPAKAVFDSIGTSQVRHMNKAFQ
jgi:hypothetical protein